MIFVLVFLFPALGLVGGAFVAREFISFERTHHHAPAPLADVPVVNAPFTHATLTDATWATPSPLLADDRELVGVA